MMDRNTTLSDGGDRQEPGFARWPLTAALLATFGLAAFGAFSPGRRLWGVNHLAFYPLTVRLLALAIVAVSFLPAVGRLVSRSIVGAVSALDARPGLRRWLAPLAAVTAVAIFIGFHSSTLLLGDGRLIANSFESGLENRGMVTAGSPGAILLHEPFAKGTSLLHHAAARLSVSAFRGTPLWGIRVAAAALGGILVLVLARALLGSHLSPEVRAWSLALGLATGATQVFFGYVENYALLLVCCALYLLCGLVLAARRSAAWIWPAVVFLALSVFAHVQAVALVPSAVFLAAVAAAARTGRSVPRYLALILVGVAAAVTCGLAVLTRLDRHFLPLAGSDQTYGVFSPAHLVDAANEVLLLVPAAILVLAAAVAPPGRGSVGERDGRGQGASATADRPGGSDQWRFVFLVLIPALGFLVLVRPDLGMPRDWDLFSVAAVPLIGAAVLVLRRLETRAGARNLGPILVPGLVLSAVLAAAWIGVNGSADRSLARFEAILKYDRSRSDYAHEVLAAEYRDRGRIGRATEVLQEALASGGPSRLAVTLSSYYEEAGRKDDAIRLLRETLTRDPRSERARYHLMRLLSSEKAYGELLEVARTGTELHPLKPVFRYSHGSMLLLAGQTQAGLAELRECLRLNPPQDVRQEIERMLADRPWQLPKQAAEIVGPDDQAQHRLPE